MSLLQAPWQLYLFYGVIFGIGMSGIWAPILSLISRWFTVRRGMLTGIVISGGGLGAFIGPPVITSLLNNYGWVQSTLILGSFVLVMVFVAAQFLKRDPSQVGQIALWRKDHLRIRTEIDKSRFFSHGSDEDSPILDYLLHVFLLGILHFLGPGPYHAPCDTIGNTDL